MQITIYYYSYSCSGPDCSGQDYFGLDYPGQDYFGLDYSDYRNLLTKLEQEEYQKLSQPLVQKQYLISRLLLKTGLSEYASCNLGYNLSAGDWLINKDQHGKPYVANESLPEPISFNLSHTKGMVIAAITSGSPIGIDIENIAREVNILGIANRFFADREYKKLQAMTNRINMGNKVNSNKVNNGDGVWAQQREYFFKLWTQKEAYAKALGKGVGNILGIDMENVLGEDKLWNVREIILVANGVTYIGAVVFSNDLVGDVKAVGDAKVVGDVKVNLKFKNISF